MMYFSVINFYEQSWESLAPSPELFLDQHTKLFQPHLHQSGQPSRKEKENSGKQRELGTDNVKLG